MTERPRSLQSVRDTVPTHVSEAVHTALEKLPTDRFASAAELARALENQYYRVTRSGEALVEPPRLRATKLTPARLVLGAKTLVLAVLAAWG
jgi:eukaryotic-like serine/threonine-protein kinase